MNRTRIIRPDSHAEPGFHPCRLRESLDTFIPGEQTLCNNEVQAYLAYYGLEAVSAMARYSIGTELIGDTLLVVQHFSRAHSRGTAVVVHGYTDHAGLYRHLIAHLLDQHWDVLIYDLPGHGLSSGQRYAIDTFRTYARQLTSLLQRHEHKLTMPCVGIGQSTGGAILLQVALERQRASLLLRDRVLLSPLVRPRHFNRIELSYRWLHWCLKRVNREHSESSNDSDFVHFMRHHDPMQGNFVDVGWVGAMLEWVHLVESVDAIQIPALIVQGTDDQTLEWEHNLEVLARLLPRANIERLVAARHHLVNEAEPWRREVLDRISQRLKTHSRPQRLPRVAV
ncbi:alpha/beta hydrolase [Marinobacterium sediminicola]|uniref:Lysophospholipase, alpha-beta hydrolase superfamily n=1 Tax=Marinobacterium sediminicola TaxID=518898 RepID=A0ABY1S2I5_9GAMM|nr:alpha/beta hydrolase [Marinobacterium sediminicola]ULG69505.1 alpha/beta hydrolase [Marinobacterium sediminicola]SMR75655.1 Lysophospholipase, alpha-beta hydrolase superfamily [Marinobacterium sediminicola]